MTMIHCILLIPIIARKDGAIHYYGSVEETEVFPLSICPISEIMDHSDWQDQQACSVLVGARREILVGSWNTLHLRTFSHIG